MERQHTKSFVLLSIDPRLRTRSLIDRAQEAWRSGEKRTGNGEGPACRSTGRLFFLHFVCDDLSQEADDE